MTKDLLLLLIARHGIPVALEIVALFQSNATVEEMLPRLKELGTRTAGDYERALQP